MRSWVSPSAPLCLLGGRTPRPGFLPPRTPRNAENAFLGLPLCATLSPLRYTPPPRFFTAEDAEERRGCALRPPPLRTSASSAVTPPTQFFTAEDAEERRGCVLGSPPLRTSASSVVYPTAPVFHRRGRRGTQRMRSSASPSAHLGVLGGIPLRPGFSHQRETQYLASLPPNQLPQPGLIQHRHPQLGRLGQFAPRTRPGDHVAGLLTHALAHLAAMR